MKSKLNQSFSENKKKQNIKRKKQTLTENVQSRFPEWVTKVFNGYVRFTILLVIGALAVSAAGNELSCNFNVSEKKIQERPQEYQQNLEDIIAQQEAVEKAAEKGKEAPPVVRQKVITPQKAPTLDTYQPPAREPVYTPPTTNYDTPDSSSDAGKNTETSTGNETTETSKPENSGNTETETPVTPPSGGGSETGTGDSGAAGSGSTGGAGTESGGGTASSGGGGEQVAPPPVTAPESSGE